MKKEIENKLELANLQIKKVVDFIKENKNAFDSMNLKIYDVSMYCGSDEMKKDFPLCCEKYENDLFSIVFNDFCNIEYEVFKENLMTENEIDFEKMVKYIGRTSSFYLHDFSNISQGIEYILYDLYDKFVGGYDLYYMDFNIHGELFVFDEENIEENEEEILNNIDYFINDFYNDIIGNLKDIVTVYEEIEYFKKNQVEIFKEYLEFYEDEIKEEKEEELRIEKEKENTVNSIKEKYNISNDDMDILKKNL